MSEVTFYEAIGGRATIELIVHTFYDGVAGDDVLREMYPEDDLGPAAERLTMFLEQYWGGPTTYQQQRGHPRLKMRHVPYRINQLAHDRWLEHFRAGLDKAALPAEYDAQFWGYILHAARFMINTEG